MLLQSIIHKARVVLISALIVTGLSACATAGAPPPGELNRDYDCAPHELLICPEKSGSRIAKEYGTCTCQPKELL